MILKSQQSPMGVSGVVKQFLKDSKVSNLFYLAMQEEWWKILHMSKYAQGKPGMQNQFRSNLIRNLQLLKKYLMFSGIHTTQLLLIDKAMMSARNIDLQYFIITKNKEIAEKSKRELEKEDVYNDPIVTEITPFRNFYVAEDYHKNYYENNQSAPYCNFVIDPKVNKLLLKYGNNVKEEYIR
jgi:hypothetical protein